MSQYCAPPSEPSIPGGELVPGPATEGLGSRGLSSHTSESGTVMPPAGLGIILGEYSLIRSAIEGLSRSLLLERPLTTSAAANKMTATTPIPIAPTPSRAGTPKIAGLTLRPTL